MSESSKRGRTFEQGVAKLIQRKLGARCARDPRSGAGSHQKADITNFYNDIPLSIECKDQETLKVKEWMRQAIDAASFHQVPTLVFAMDTETLACVRFEDLLNLLVEIADLRAEVSDLRLPAPAATPASAIKNIAPAKLAEKAVQQKAATGVKFDKNGHIVDQYGYCMQKGCKFSRYYRPPKGKK